jgi:hypothetical protein
MNRRTFLTAAVAATIPTPAIASPGEGHKTMLVAGQSLAMPWREQYVQDAFREDAGQTWKVFVAGRGGTSAASWQGGKPPSYCWTIDGRRGPVLNEAILKIRASGIKPDVMLWSQGQADGGAWNPELCSAAEFVSTYVKTVLAITVELRKAAAGKRWRRIPCMIQTIGWVTDANGCAIHQPGWDLVRHAQGVMLAYHSKAYNLMPGAVQTPWAKLKDGIHPTDEEYAILARMTAKAIGQIS